MTEMTYMSKDENLRRKFVPILAGIGFSSHDENLKNI